MQTSQALVVGATSEIGSAVAAMLAAEHYDLLLWGRDAARLEAVERKLGSTGVGCRSALVDVTDHAQVRDHLEMARETGALRVVVWSVGVFDWAPADRADPAVWAQLLEVNLTAAAVLTASALPALVDAAPSALVFIGSAAGRHAYANNAAYVASKHGLAGLATATFLDVRDRDVKVSVVSPGLVAAGAGLSSPAGQTRPDTLLDPADVAAAVRFVVTFPTRGCPVEIDLQTQRSV